MIGTETFFDHLPDESHRVLHFATDDLLSATVAFASKAVANAIVAREVLNNVKDCEDLAFNNESPAAAVLRGRCFKSFVHIRVSASLGKHIEFLAQPLGTGPYPQHETVSLVCTSSRILESVNDVAELVPGQYGPIGGANFPAVDGVLKREDGSVDLLLAVTNNQDHGIKIDALNDIVTALGVAPAMVRILWIVTMHMRGFPPQSSFGARVPTRCTRAVMTSSLSSVRSVRVRGRLPIRAPKAEGEGDAPGVEGFMDSLNRGVPRPL